VDGNPLWAIDPLGLISEVEVANVVYNETRSFSGTDVDYARYTIAQAIFNGAEAEESGRIKRRPKAAPSTAKVPATEAKIYQSCLDAAMNAQNDRVQATDPTRGSIFFNFRGNSSMANRYGLPVQTHVGPLNNSYPTTVLPSSGNYANTYGSGR
jgi:hypothetical protein